jgi:hypothetical protein
MSSPQLITAIVQSDRVRTAAAMSEQWWSYAKTVLASAALALVAEGRACPRPWPEPRRRYECGDCLPPTGNADFSGLSSI